MRRCTLDGKRSTTNVQLYHRCVRWLSPWCIVCGTTDSSKGELAMTKKHFVELAKDLEHANALVKEGVLPSAQSVLKHLAFSIGSTCNTFNHNFNWYKWNVAIFGEEPEDVSRES